MRLTSRLLSFLFKNLFLLSLLIGTAFSAAQNPTSDSQPDSQKSGDHKISSSDTKHEFDDEDAVRVLDTLRRSLDNDNQEQLLNLFDPAKMLGYPAFRDRIAAFFDAYESFEVHYHLSEAVREGANGIALADFEIAATPAGGYAPSVRRHVQLRLTLNWDGKSWKIVELSPRSLFGPP